jgi:hypothetical protein
LEEPNIAETTQRSRWSRLLSGSRHAQASGRRSCVEPNRGVLSIGRRSRSAAAPIEAGPLAFVGSDDRASWHPKRGAGSAGRSRILPDRSHR